MKKFRDYFQKRKDKFHHYSRGTNDFSRENKLNKFEWQSVEVLLYRMQDFTKIQNVINATTDLFQNYAKLQMTS